MPAAKKILRYLLGFILLAFLSAIVLFQLPSFQTWLAVKAVEAIQDKVDGKVEIESVHLKFINTVAIKGLRVIDTNPPAEDAYDTLLRVGSLGVRFSLLSLLTHGCVSLKSVKLKDSRMNLVIKHNEKYTTNLNRIFRIPLKDSTKRMTKKPLIHIDKIVAENIEFGMRNYSTPSKARHPWNVDWTDLEVKEINLLASDFDIRDAHFTFNAEALSFKEKSGWNILEFACRGVVGDGEVHLYDTRLRDGFGTDAELDYSMLGRSHFYQNFINKIRMDGRIRRSRVSMSTLARVIPVMYPDSTTFATLNGHAHGTVSDLHADSLNLGFENNSFNVMVDGRISGLPDVNMMRIDSKISDMRFTTADLTRILNSIVQKKKIDLRKFGKSCVYRGSVETRGLLNGIAAAIRLDQYQDADSRGGLVMNVKLNDVLAKGVRPLTVSGSIVTDMLDLSPLLGKEIADDISLSTKVDLKLPSRKNKLQATLDSLEISSVSWHGHNYKNLEGRVALDGDEIEAGLHARDSALKADVKLWTSETEYHAGVKLKMADLHKMNFDSRELSVVHCDVSAAIDKNMKKPQGKVLVSGIRLYNETGAHAVENITADAVLNGENYEINLTSGGTIGKFTGNRNRFNSEIRLGETFELLNFIKPGLYVENGTSIIASRDSAGRIRGNFKSGRVALKKNYLKNLTASVSGPLDSLKANIKSDDICAADFHLQNSDIKASWVNSLLCLDYNYRTVEEKHVYGGHLRGSALINPDKSLNIKLEPSEFLFDNNKWELKESVISKTGQSLSVDNFVLSHADQYIKIDGGMHTDLADTLVAKVKDIDMSGFNNLIKDKNLDIHGILSAEGKIISPRIMDMQLIEGLPRIELQLRADSLKLKDMDYGQLNALCEYEHENKRFVIDVNEMIADRHALVGKMYFAPKKKDLEISATMDRFPFGFLSSFTEKIFSGLDGYLTATVDITRKDGVMDLECKKGRIDEGMLKVAFTYVPYYIDGTFSMDNNGVHFKEMLVHDRGQGSGVAKGGLKWKRLKDMEMDMHLDVKNIEALDIPSNVNNAAFYGNVIATGDVHMTGPVNNMLLAADARTSGPSNMHFVVSGNMDATKGERLSFVDPYVKDIDPYVKMLEEQNSVKKAESGMVLKLRVDADQNFKANLDMTGTGFAAGAAGVGKGMINLDVDTRTKQYSILGDYKLEEGIFDFNASDIVHRQFNIKDGSVIKFCGDIPKTELNLEADYQTKASIAPLIADTTSVSNRRLVQCGINLAGKLTNPSISFSIHIPDLDPSVQTSVESALNTDAKVQRQFLSILVSNNFLPNEENGIVNNSSILYSNVSELMATQINNIFAKLDIPLDLGLNYQPTDKGQNLFDVALSTQLWNNRVIIGGSLGNRQSTNSTGTTLFGDLDIEYKVTRNGAVRVKAFTHAADQYSNNLDQSQRNGVGATWQQEFDNIAVWWKMLFMKKEERLKFMEQQSKKAKETKRITLDE